MKLTPLIRPYLLALVLPLLLAAPAGAALPATDGPWPGYGTAGDADVLPPSAAPGSTQAVYAAAIQSTGRIITPITEGNTGVDEIVVQGVDRDGHLDPTFGTGGIVRLPVPGTLEVTDIVIDPQDRILVAGRYVDTTDTVLFVQRLTVDGAIDATYGVAAGRAEVRSCSWGDSTFALRLRASGGVHVGVALDPTCVPGVPTVSGNMAAGLLAFDAAGDVEPGYAAPVNVSEPGTESVTHIPADVVDMPDGSSVLVEVETNGPLPIRTRLTRLAPGGIVDTTWATNGVADLPDVHVLGAFPEPNGAITLAIADRRPGSGGTTVTQLDPSGALDSAWGAGGRYAVSEPAGTGLEMVPTGAVAFRDAHGFITLCGLGIQSTDGFVMQADFMHVISRWDSDGVLRERHREVLDMSSGDYRFLTGCAPGSDGRLVMFGIDISGGGTVYAPYISQRYARYDYVAPLLAVAESTVGGSTTYTVTASDASSGLEDVDGAYSFDGGASWQAAASATLPALQPGDADRVVRVRDRAGTFVDRTFVAPSAPAAGGGGSSLPAAPTPAAPAPSPAAPVPQVVPSVLGSGSASYDAVSFAAQVLDPAGDRSPYRYSFDGGASWQAASTATVSGLGRKVTRSASIVVEASDGARSVAVAVSQTTRDNGVPAVNVGVTGTTTTRGHVVKPVPKVLTGGELEVVARSDWGGIGEISATFRGGSVPVVDGRIDVTRMREGSGTLTVRATDVDGDVGSFSRNLRVDRTAPTLKSVTGTYVIGPTVRLRASDFGSGVVSPRITVKLESRTGAMTVKAKVRDRAGNLQKRGVTVNRRIALRDQILNRDLRLVSRDGSHYAPVKGGSHGAFRFLDYVQPYYSQLEYQDPYVKEAQWRLAKLGCLKPGSFQPGRLDMSTIRAVQAYQVIKGFEVLGTVGPRTRHALDLDLLRGLPANTCR